MFVGDGRELGGGIAGGSLRGESYKHAVSKLDTPATAHSAG